MIRKATKMVNFRSIQGTAKTMARQNWKRVRPRSITHAMQLCKDYAREKHNLGIDRIADGMTVTSVDTLYKWMGSGRMPANMVRAFENTCRCDFVTQYIATSAHKLLIDIPSSKPAAQEDLLALHSSFNHAVEVLAKFYKGEAETADALGELTRHMSEMAAHRVKVENVSSPELDFSGDDL